MLHINADAFFYRHLPWSARLEFMMAELLTVAEKLQTIAMADQYIARPGQQTLPTKPIVGVSHLARLLELAARRAGITRQVVWSMAAAPPACRQLFVNSSAAVARSFGDPRPIPPSDVKAICLQPSDFLTIMRARQERAAFQHTSGK